MVSTFEHGLVHCVHVAHVDEAYLEPGRAEAERRIESAVQGVRVRDDVAVAFLTIAEDDVVFAELERVVDPEERRAIWLQDRGRLGAGV